MSEQKNVKKRPDAPVEPQQRNRLVTGSNATSTTKKIEIDLDEEDRRDEEER